jgi:hypothetical protein
MHPEFPVERVCRHLYEPFQLIFARHAQQLLPKEDELEVEASHKGLVLRGETEAVLERPAEILQGYFGNQIRIGGATVRYHNGSTPEEPHMGLRVRCPTEHFERVKADLDARYATIVSSEITPLYAVIRASAPLARLIGYAQTLKKLTSGQAHEVMWLSHYAPVETPPPDGHAA